MQRNSTSFFYNRVPKCGSKGISGLFNRLAIRNQFTSRKVNPPGGLNHHMEINEQNRTVHRFQNIKNPKVYTRHVHFLNFSEFGLEMPTYVNVVRKPLSRALSAYYYRRAGIHHRYVLADKKLSFEQCIKMNKTECVADQYNFIVIPYFCGHDDFCLTPSERSLEQAKRNVIDYFVVVGYLEEIYKFVEVLEFLWPRMFKDALSVYRNMSAETLHKKSKKVAPSEEQGNIMKERLKIEYNFYYFVKHRFDCLYDSLFPMKS